MKISRRLMLRLSGLGATTMALMAVPGAGRGIFGLAGGAVPLCIRAGHTGAARSAGGARPGAACAAPLQRRPADR